MNIKDFFSATEDILKRYEHLQPSLDDAIAKKEIAEEIALQIDSAISNVDMEKLQESFDISLLPSFEFDKEQTEKMVSDVFNDIMSENITLIDYINSQDEAIFTMQDCVVGGIEEEYDPEKPDGLIYHYKKDLEVSRAAALDALIQCQNLASGNIPENLTTIFAQKDSMMANFGIVYEVDSVSEHISHISATITAHAALKVLACNVNEEQLSSELSKSRVFVETIGKESDVEKMHQKLSETIEEICKDHPELRAELDGIKESYFVGDIHSDIEKRKTHDEDIGQSL